MDARWQAAAEIEILRQALVEVRPFEIQESGQPVPHEGVKPVARGVAPSAHQFAEMAVVGVAPLRLRVEPIHVARGQRDIQERRDFHVR